MMEELTKSFSVTDYIVFVASLVISLCVGLYYVFFKKQTTNAEFLMAGRSMTVFPVSMSLLASFISAITILALPAEMYYNGIQYFCVSFAMCLSVVIVGTTFMPLLYHLKVLSMYEYLELRFNSRLVRQMATVTFMVKSICYMAVVLFTPALALSVVTPLTTWASIFTVGGICSIYTAFGGLRAVLWTDVFQVIMMMAGIIAVVIQGTVHFGGLSEIWRIADEGGRTLLFDFRPDPFMRINFWSIMLGQTCNWVAIYGCSQTSVQRYLSMRSYKEAQWALFINVPMILTVNILAYLTGLIAYAVYVDCDPLTAGLTTKTDQIMPFYVMNQMNHITGLPGLFVACVFSASLSTLSSGLNALASVTWEDFLQHTHCGKHLIKYKLDLWANKFIALFYGGLSVGMAFVVGEIGSVLDALVTVSGAVTGPLLAVFLMAVFYPWSNKKGLIVGMTCGYIVCLWLAIGSRVTGKSTIKTPLSLSTVGCDDSLNITKAVTTKESVTSPLDAEKFEGDDIYRISFMIYTFIGSLITVLLAIPVSYFTGGYPVDDMDPALVSPLVRKYVGKNFERNFERNNIKLNKVPTYRKTEPETHTNYAYK